MKPDDIHFQDRENTRYLWSGRPAEVSYRNLGLIALSFLQAPGLQEPGKAKTGIMLYARSLFLSANLQIIKGTGMTVSIP